MTSRTSGTLKWSGVVLALVVILIGEHLSDLSLPTPIADALPGWAAPSEAQAQRKRRRRRRPRQIKLEIFSLTEGAEVFVDGELYGAIPLEGPITLEPGEHVVKVSKRGHVDYFETHQFKYQREPYVIEADLLPFSGILIIETEPTGAQVIVDGALLGETPFEGEIDGGIRTILLKARGYLPLEEKREIVAGEIYTMSLSLQVEEIIPEAPPFWTTWWFWTGVSAVAVVGLGIGALVLFSEDEEPPLDIAGEVPIGLEFRPGGLRFAF